MRSSCIRYPGGTIITVKQHIREIGIRRSPVATAGRAEAAALGMVAATEGAATAGLLLALVAARVTVIDAIRY